MEIQALQHKITELTEPELAERGFELFGVVLSKRGNRRLVTLLIDHADGGISMDECAAWNRVFIEKIETSGLIEGDYVVEVSSPGLDRPLMEERDYRRLNGKKIWFQFRDTDSRLVEAVRVVRGVEQGKILLAEDGSESQEWPLASVLNAKPEILVKR